VKPGKAFELLVRNILLYVGFSPVKSDGLYIFDGSPGQMIQGLGDAHNADVLLEPPVQTPFYASTRLLIECKDYNSRVGLGIIRSGLGLREDINHFDIVDRAELESRRHNRRSGIVHNYQRHLYQVAFASMSGFTIPAQNFAATHRIPLIEFNKMPFWEDFRIATNAAIDRAERFMEPNLNLENDQELFCVIRNIAERFAVAITNDGQLIFLYRIRGDRNHFDDLYSLHWNSPNEPWELYSGETTYQFQLPDNILKFWLENSATDLDRKVNAVNCKIEFMSNMVIYYSEHGCPRIKMVSIDRYQLQETMAYLNNIRSKV